jgi:hypothetical protein
MSQSFMATSSGRKSARTLVVEADITRHFHLTEIVVEGTTEMRCI